MTKNGPKHHDPITAETDRSLGERVETIEAELWAQEHRPLKVLGRFMSVATRDESRPRFRKAAALGLVSWLLLGSGPVIATGAILAYLNYVQLVRQTDALIEQNQLVAATARAPIFNQGIAGINSALEDLDYARSALSMVENQEFLRSSAKEIAERISSDQAGSASEAGAPTEWDSYSKKLLEQIKRKQVTPTKYRFNNKHLYRNKLLIDGVPIKILYESNGLVSDWQAKFIQTAKQSRLSETELDLHSGGWRHMNRGLTRMIGGLQVVAQVESIEALRNLRQSIRTCRDLGAIDEECNSRILVALDDLEDLMRNPSSLQMMELAARRTEAPETAYGFVAFSLLTVTRALQGQQPTTTWSFTSNPARTKDRLDTIEQDLRTQLAKIRERLDSLFVAPSGYGTTSTPE